MNVHRSNTIGFNRWLAMMCVWGAAVVIALTATPSADATGFNVNSDVTFTPLASTYETTTSTTGCPAAFSGKFTFTALLTSKPGSPAMPGLTVRAVTLTNGNLLLDPQANAVLGGERAEMTVRKVDEYADGVLSAGESVHVPFVLCLKTLQPFQFFVDVVGIVTQLVSVNRFGTGSGNLPFSDSVNFAISAAGRYVAFTSSANDLVANDTNGLVGDVFVRDLELGTTALVSVNRFGTGSGNRSSLLWYFSADGRFVLFTSRATDLVANDTNGIIGDLFLRDLQMGTTTLVSVNQFGTGSGNSDSFVGRISADGRFVLFTSSASDLAPNDTNGFAEDLFLRDLELGTTALVSVNRFGTESGNGSSSPGWISADSRYVAFTSSASDLAPNDTNGFNDVFVRDLQTGTTTLVSINRFGTGSTTGAGPGAPGQIFRGSSGGVISADGRFVIFTSRATDLVANDTNGFIEDVFVRDLQLGTTTLVSVNRSGAGSGDSSSFGGAISADGRFVSFTSGATDLVASDSNGTNDVFVRDLQSGTTALVSVNRFGTGSGNRFSVLGSMSADGRYVAFSGEASDLVANDTNGFIEDVFIRDLQQGTTTLVSVNRSGTGSGNSFTGSTALSAGGRYVAFLSSASDLVANDTNGTEDVFVRPVEP